MQLNGKRVTDASAICVGIDLAWFDHNPSGVAIWQDGAVVACTGTLGGDDEVIDFIRPWLARGQAAVFAVDAPLRVPNETGARPCERALNRVWGHAHAGARPAYRANLARNQVVRGEALSAQLCRAFGAVETPHVQPAAGGRYVCEVYPHPAMVALFGLARTLKYKRGTRAQRLPGFARYVAFMQTLSQRVPPLQLPVALAETNVDSLRGRALKEFEDTLDAVFCAYIAAHLWHYGPAGAEVFGDVENGHIVVPKRVGPKADAPPFEKEISNHV